MRDKTQDSFHETSQKIRKVQEQKIMETVKAIFTSYYFWLAVEAVIITVLLVFVTKYSKLKKERAAELDRKKESSRYAQLDEQLTGRKGRN